MSLSKRYFFLTAAFFLWLGAGPVWGADLALDVSTAEGGTTIDFGTIKSLESNGSLPSGMYQKEVRLVVTSTLKQRYVLSQIVHTPPVGSRGEMFDLGLMSCYATLRQGEGELRIAHPTPLSTGEQEIFFSSGSGSMAEIILVYRIDMPPGNEAGVYNTSITYKVSTL